MMQAPRFLTGRRGDELLWAAIDELAHHLPGRVCERRFAAYCAPYRCEDEARQALIEAGADNIAAEERKRGRRG